MRIWQSRTMNYYDGIGVWEWRSKWNNYIFFTAHAFFSSSPAATAATASSSLLWPPITYSTFGVWTKISTHKNFSRRRSVFSRSRVSTAPSSNLPILCGAKSPKCKRKVNGEKVSKVWYAIGTRDTWSTIEHQVNSYQKLFFFPFHRLSIVILLFVVLVEIFIFAAHAAHSSGGERRKIHVNDAYSAHCLIGSREKCRRFVYCMWNNERGRRGAAVQSEWHWMNEMQRIWLYCFNVHLPQSTHMNMTSICCRWENIKIKIACDARQQSQCAVHFPFASFVPSAHTHTHTLAQNHSAW